LSKKNSASGVGRLGWFYEFELNFNINSNYLLTFFDFFGVAVLASIRAMKKTKYTYLFKLLKNFFKLLKIKYKIYKIIV
jgi:hypothetical protein